MYSLKPFINHSSLKPNKQWFKTTELSENDATNDGMKGRENNIVDTRLGGLDLATILAL